MGVAAFGAAVQAAPYLTASLPSMVEESDVAVVGEVVDLTVAQEGGNIYTTAKIEVDQYLKGAAGPYVFIKSMGGSMGNITQVVDGGPQFQIGQEAVYFLHQRGDHFITFGLSYGVLPVVEEDGRKVVKGHFFRADNHYNVRTKARMDNPEPMIGKPLSEFAQQVRQLAQ
jgi:hypothetical protein